MSTIGTVDQTASAKPRARRTAKPDGRKAARADSRVKVTVLTPADLDFRLAAVSAHLKMDKSGLACQLIDAGLRRYALDAALRQFAGADSPGPVDADGIGS